MPNDSSSSCSRRNLARALAGIALYIASAAIAQPLTEAGVRVAYIFNFGKFVEWPAATLERRERFTICHTGAAGTLVRGLGQLEDKVIHGKPIEVSRITTAAAIRNCLVVVFTDSEARNPRRDWLRAAEEASALTVGDAEGFTAAGGAIGLVNVDDKVVFEINLEAARSASLRIPAQLAKLGRVVASNR